MFVVITIDLTPVKHKYVVYENMIPDLKKLIKDIDKNNKNMKSITNFNLSLNDIKKDLEENHKTIRELLNENEDLNVNLEEQVNYWKNKLIIGRTNSQKL